MTDPASRPLHGHGNLWIAAFAGMTSHNLVITIISENQKAFELSGYDEELFSP
jgi:hypothetical protein